MYDPNTIFIKMSDATKQDIEYIDMLLNNWNNYYKPENYLLPNTEIVYPFKPYQKISRL